MIIFGEYMYYGFGSTKLTALHNFFINFIALTYCGESQVAFENIILGRQGSKPVTDNDVPKYTFIDHGLSVPPSRRKQ